MSALRRLSGIYVAAASFYGVAAILSSHPQLTASTGSAIRDLAIRTANATQAAEAAVAGPARALAIKETAAFAAALETERAFAKAWFQEREMSPVIVRLDLPPLRETPRLAALSGLSKESNRAAPLAEQSPALPPLGAADLAHIKERFKESLTRELYRNFELFLYVSKAARGPWAQRMYVFRKDGRSNDLTLLYNWLVSTGRERVEYNAEGRRLPTYTPVGYYELDPRRSYRHHVSLQWHQPMPYALFFNWVKGGLPTGLAIHGATAGDVGLLGTRASAGCVRLPPEAARTLFTLVRAQYRGLVPRFAIDRRTGTMSNNGNILHDAAGRPILAEGYKVLVFVENYGGVNEVAALY